MELFEVSTSTTIVILTSKLNITSTNKSKHNLINLDLNWTRFVLDENGFGLYFTTYNVDVRTKISAVKSFIQINKV